MNASQTTARTHDAPLQGRRIVITRARAQAAGLVERLRVLGAVPVQCPAIAIAPPEDFAPLDRAIADLPGYDWVIFTSANAVEAVAQRILATGRGLDDLRTRNIGAIGPATASALQRIGCEVRFMPDTYVAEAVVEQLGDVLGQRILLPRADLARKTLAEGLRAKGALVDEVTAYRTVRDRSAPSLYALLEGGTVDAVTFTSSSTVRYTVESMLDAGLSAEQVAGLLNRTKIVCIGPVTAGTAREYGLVVAAIAEEYTTEGLLDSLVKLFAQDG
jgi:uroporphyrinogen III methyltransferase/synthase